MARGKKNVIAPAHGDNVTDELRAEFYRKALQAKQEHEKALELAKSAGGVYRAVLKSAKKAGVDSEAIASVLAIRFADPDLILMKQRETVRMLAVSGVMPRIQTDLFNALGLEPQLSDEEMAKVEVERAYENGTKAGREGENRSVNGYPPGSELFDAFDRGWIAGQEGLVKGIFGSGEPATGPTEPEDSDAQEMPRRAGRVKGKRGAKNALPTTEPETAAEDADFAEVGPTSEVQQTSETWY